jgi:glutaredoxin
MIKLYSKDNCQQCVQTENFLKSRNIAVTVLKLGKDFEMEDVLHTGTRSFPIVFDDDKFIGGMKETMNYVDYLF